MGSRRYGRYRFDVSNEDKILFPEIGLTKRGLIEYYESVADAILPHLRRRALGLERFPDGIDTGGFHQKQASDHFPEWIETTRVAKQDGTTHELVVCRNRATLAYLAGQACVVLHAWLSRCDRPEHPDQLVFDLDPPGDDFAAARRAAQRVRALLEELELPGFLKLSGSTGLHVVVPLDRSEPFDAVRAFARDAAALLAARHPDELTTQQRVDKRRGRLYLDVGRNAYAQTLVAPYSLRASATAPVAAPIEWDELDDPDLDARRYTVHNVLRRLGQRGDPWRGMARRGRSLAGARRRLEARPGSASTRSPVE